MEYINVELTVLGSGVGALKINGEETQFNALSEFTINGENKGGIVCDFIYHIVGGLFAVIGLRDIPSTAAGVVLSVNAEADGRVLLANASGEHYSNEPMVDAFVTSNSLYVRTFYSDGSQQEGYPIDQFVPSEPAPVAETNDESKKEDVHPAESADTATPVFDAFKAKVS